MKNLTTSTKSQLSFSNAHNSILAAYLSPISILLFLLWAGSLSGQWVVKHIAENNQNTLNVIKFNGRDLGFAMGSDGLILRSVDFGENWDRIDHQIDGNIDAFTFLDSETVLLSANTITGAPVGTLCRSFDGGTTWSTQPLDEKVINSLEAISPTTVIASGLSQIYKSTDSGSNWEVVFDLLEEGYASGSVVDLHMVTNTVGYALARALKLDSDKRLSILVKTTNAGDDWEPILVTEGFFKKVKFENPMTGYIASSQVTYRTSNEGITWDTLSNVSGVVDFSISSATTVRTVNRPEGYLFGPTYFALSESLDAGQTWSGQYQPGLHLESIYFENDTVGFVAGDNAIIMKTTSGGGAFTGGYPWDLFVSIKELTSTPLYLYPNPAQDYITIQIDEDSQWTFAIYNPTGKEVQKGRLVANLVDLSNLPRGSYFLVLESQGERKLGQFVRE